jgi:hypothetical protein
MWASLRSLGVTPEVTGLVIGLSPCWFKSQHLLKIVQRVQHLLDCERGLDAASPVRPILRPNDQIVVANKRRIVAGEEQSELLLDLVLMRDQEIAGGTIATGFIDRHRVTRVDMDHER